MKKLTAILLIIMIISPLWIFYSIIRYEKYITKKEIKNFLISKIDNSDLVLLKFSCDEAQTKLKWEHSKEFEYLEEMYDVVRLEFKNDSIYYWCWHDKEETNLNKKLESLVKQTSGNLPFNREMSQKLFNYFSSFYSLTSSSSNNINNGEKLILFSSYSNNYSSQFISPDLPPPRV